MALSSEQTQTFERLGDFQPARFVLEGARQLIDQHDPTAIDGIYTRYDWAQESYDEEAQARHHERLVINLSEKAISIAIIHSDAPLDLGQRGVHPVVMNPRVTFGANVYDDGSFHQVFANVYASSIINQPRFEGRDAESMSLFSGVLAHTASRLGLYRQAQQRRLEGELAG
jgi:hypothetical protein